MSLPYLLFTRSWLNADDFPTIEPDETKVREDLQFHADAIKNYLNETLLPSHNGILEKGVKCPGVLSFSGAVTARYDGESDVQVRIPIGGAGGGTTATTTLGCLLDAGGATVTFDAFPTGYTSAFDLINDSYAGGQTVQLNLSTPSGGKQLYLAAMAADGSYAKFIGYEPATEAVDAAWHVVTVYAEGNGTYEALDTNPFAPIISTTAPTASTVGIVGQEYIDTAAKLVYKCVAAGATGYTWISADKNLQDTKQDKSTAITTSNIGSQTVNYAKYATDGVAVGTPALRNQSFASAESTPTVNGQICWVYG